MTESSKRMAAQMPKVQTSFWTSFLFNPIIRLFFTLNSLLKYKEAAYSRVMCSKVYSFLYSLDFLGAHLHLLLKFRFLQ